MNTKLSKLKAAWAAGDYVGALRIAAKFPRLGDDRDAISRAWAAYQSPEFYREIGRNPDELFAAGISAIAERYGLPPAVV